MTTAPARVPEEEPTPAPDAIARRRVRNYLLDSRLQLRLASYLLGAAALLSMGLGWLLWRAYRETSQVLELADPTVGAALGTALASEDRFRIVAVVVALVLVLCCLLAAAVVVTHRIAGPAFAIGRTCRRVADGDLTEPPPLRTHDLLVDLGDEVSAMVRELRSREGQERDLLAAAIGVLRDPFSSAQARQELARQLEALASEKERRLGP